MIYYIDRSVGEELSQRNLSEDEQLFFQDLANSRRHGFCYLCGDVNSLNTLSKHKISGVYDTIRNHYAESGAAMKMVELVFVLTYTQDISSLPLFLQEENRYIFIPIPTAIQEEWALNKKCCLLAENLDDCKFYQLIAEYYCQIRDLFSVAVEFHCENGGGNTICDVLKKCVTDDKNLVLCLVDSDRRYDKSKAYPNAPAVGDTFHRVETVSGRLIQDATFPPHCLKKIHAHEVENLIPTKILRELQQTQLPSMEQGLNRLIDLIHLQKQGNVGEPALCYDYKNGMPYLKEGPMREYWREILLALGGSEVDMPPTNKPKGKSDNSGTLFFPPLSGKILNKIITNMANHPLHGDGVDEYLRPLWMEIGVLLLTWGYADALLSA